MMAVLRRASIQTTAQLFLLLLAFSAFVAGLGQVVRGAETSAFLPAVIPAIFLGWYLGRTRLKAWLSLAGLLLLGVLLLWGRTAQSGPAVVLLLVSLGMLALQNFLHLLHANQLMVDMSALAAIQAVTHSLGVQSMVLWTRLEAWLRGLFGGTDINDPVVRVLVWSMLLWVLAIWAGWAVGRNRVLAGLLPGLVVMTAITKYTNSDVAPLWLMTTSMLALMSLSRFDANLRRWFVSRLDYAELIISNTMLTAALLTMVLAALGWVLPLISAKDILESFRRHAVAENQAARSLGLEAARQEQVRPPLAVSVPLRPAGLPNHHLLGSGPELSRDVVFTVRTGELSSMPVTNVQTIIPRHYWRSYSFDVYTGTGWVSSPVENMNIPAGQPLFEVPNGYKLLKQDFDLKHGDEGSLYWSGSLYRSSTAFKAAWRTPVGQFYPEAVDPLRGTDLYGATNTVPGYQVESFIPQVSEELLRAAGRATPDFIQQRYTQLPPDLPERIYALTRNLTSTAATPYDEALAIESYLRANYPYTLEVGMPPAGVDVADYFLFELKKGYCDYYATAMVVMARSVGLPARLVMGYASGTYNPTAAEYIVSAADAHAWVEVYFPGTGWVEFEPTAGQPEIIRAARVIGSAPSEVSPTFQWNRIIRSVYSMPPIALWFLAVLAFLILLLGLFFLLEDWLLGLVSPDRALRWMVRSIYRQAGHITGVSPPGQTATEFSEDLQTFFVKTDEHLSLLISQYLRVLFSPTSLQRTELRQIIKAWRALRWKLFWVQKKQQKPVK